MKKPRKLKRLPQERTKSKRQSVDINSLIKKTVDKMRDAPNQKSILVKKTSQKGVFQVRFSTTKSLNSEFLKKIQKHLSNEGLRVLHGSVQTDLNKNGISQTTLVNLKVRLKPTKQDVGHRNRNTFKKVLAFIGADTYEPSEKD